MDTPFCIVTNIHINPLCPSVLQNYISSYMIKSDWLHSAFPLRLSEITVPIYSTEEQTPSPWWKRRWHEMLLKWLGIFSDKHISVCRHGFRCGWWCEQRQSGRVKRLMAEERKSQGNERLNVPVASLPPPPHAHAHAHTHYSPSLQSTHPTLAVSFCARGQVHSSGFLARSRDTPVDPCYCGFIKSFPPLSYCVWLHVFSVYVSVFVTLQVCVCVCVHGFATGVLLLFSLTHTHKKILGKK